METKHAGNKIRSLRERKAWTQEHLAAAAEVSARTVQRAEEGAMSAETRSALAGALGVPVESLAPAPAPPTGWPRIAPVLIYDDSRAAVPWLEQAFGFETREKVTDNHGQVVHAEMVFADGMIMVTCSTAGEGWGSPKSTGKKTGFLYMFVDDLDAHYQRAVAAGATIVAEPETSHGQRRYRCLDLEGHAWTFAVQAGER